MAATGRRTLLGKLLGAYLVLMLGLLGAFGYFAHALGRSSLEDELGRRLVSIAQATAAQVNPDLFQGVEPGDEHSRSYAHLSKKLSELKMRTDARRLQLLDPARRVRVDTEPRIPIGAQAFELAVDRSEVAAAAAGRAAASVLFEGRDGLLYKRGYAPILDEKGQVIGIAAAWGGAEYFAQLERFRRWLFLFGVAAALLVTIVSVAIARKITGPLRDLAERAERIGQGDLAVSIPAPRSSDEVGLLAEAMAKMRQGLATRDEHMQMMLAGIAHEVRNPLGGMELFAGLLREELAEDKPKLEHVHRIERELSHLKRIVADFLDYARRPPPDRVPLDCRGLLSEVYDLVASQCAQEELDCRVETEGTPKVHGDASQLRRALLNLVRNAMQATPKGGSILLRCRNGDGRVRLSVTDSGSGIAVPQQEKIFVPFFTTKEKGMGLGLAFVKDIVTDHGGTVSVESHPGSGSTFSIELPSWPSSSSSTTTKPSERA